MLWPNCSCGDVTFEAAAVRCCACGAAVASSNTMAPATDAHVDRAVLLLNIGTSRNKGRELRDGSAVRGAGASSCVEADPRVGLGGHMGPPLHKPASCGGGRGRIP